MNDNEPLKFLVILNKKDDFAEILRHLEKARWRHRICRIVRFSDLKDALRHSSWDFVLADPDLKNMSVPRVLSLLRQKFPDVPVLMLGGHIGEERAADLITQGAWEYILKDNLSRLIPAIERCRRARGRRQARMTEDRKLRQSEERLRLALGASRTSAWEWDIVNGKIHIPAEWQPLGRASRGTTDLARILQLIHPDDRLLVMLHLGRALRRLRPVTATFRLTYPDGRTRKVAIEAQPHFDAQGRPVRMVGLIEDISDRHSATATIQLRRAADIVNSTQEGIVVTDAQGVILAVNRAACEITGFAEEELIGDSMRLINSNRHDMTFFRQIFDVIATDGFWQGEIWNRRKSGEMFPALMTISTLQGGNGDIATYVGTFVDMTRIKQPEQQLQHLAHHDPLTDLPNRLLLLSRLDHAIDRTARDDRCGALLTLGLDRFTNVNDNLGHPTGDMLLQMVALRLRARLRESDTLARLGGDEFAVLLEGIADAGDAATVAQSLVDEVAKPFTMPNGACLYIGISIGISLFPDDGDDTPSVVQNSDAALHQAKSAGGGRFRFYTEQMTVAANARATLEAQLRQGVESHEFFLDYQPQVSLRDHRMTGVEALVRWRNPATGLIPPAQFIPLAEETGLVGPLGTWVLEQACRQMRGWLDAGVTLDVMTVNLSAVQFRQPAFAETVAAILADSGLSPGCLELDITESGLMELGHGSEATLEGLKTLGVRLAIDDFGTGCSSLAYLRRLRIDKLKVDQSFIRDIPGDSSAVEIATAVVALGRTLHVEVQAEGVETEDQRDALRRLGCTTAQGFLFDRPLPPSLLAERWFPRTGPQ